jgi:3-deoxy-manno-octulosonate cytidylyltransferase (CMP-KDO synthetase)
VRTIGIIPARMAASRFPGKPLHPILGKPMIEHVHARASMFDGWDSLVVATCDDEIRKACESRGYRVVMTGDHHQRAFDRVAEAVEVLGQSHDVSDDDIIVCVQGDEPMLEPEMIREVVKPLYERPEIGSTVLTMEIRDVDTWLSPNVVKLVTNADGEVLYNSRSPIPWGKSGFSTDLGALRIIGIFAFRWNSLKEFIATPESALERFESCDSNRILEMRSRQWAATYPYRTLAAVDTPEDIAIVESHLLNDPLWGRY